MSPNNDEDEEGTSRYSNKTVKLRWTGKTTGALRNLTRKSLTLYTMYSFTLSVRLSSLRNFNVARENQQGWTPSRRRPGIYDRSSMPMSILSFLLAAKTSHPERSPSLPCITANRQLDQRVVYETSISIMFHLSPFKLFRKHLIAKQVSTFFQRCTTQMHSWMSMTKCNAPQQMIQPASGEKVVAALMFWSDVTHLATFGTAKLWPVYMLFGNLSKICAMSAKFWCATKHVAYIPSFPDLCAGPAEGFHQKWDSQQKGYPYSLSSGTHAQCLEVST